ncbi:hypothetical protein [Streptomyces sp. NPDC093260]|uniref:hypothetical protein n=1 Tax=Streptomyces sp. NPDC093260 TaxID=3155073 RepID=UPI003418AB30
MPPPSGLTVRERGAGQVQDALAAPRATSAAAFADQWEKLIVDHVQDRSGLVSGTSAIFPAGTPCADSGTVRARSPVTIGPVHRRTIRSSRPPSA